MWCAINPIKEPSLEIWHESCYTRIHNWASHFTSLGDGHGTANCNMFFEPGCKLVRNFTVVYF